MTLGEGDGEHLAPCKTQPCDPLPEQGGCWGVTTFLGSPFPGSFPLRSGPWGPCLLLIVANVSWFHRGLLGTTISSDIQVLSLTPRPSL